MRLYDCELKFHDNLFYETRTLGRLYETGRLLHNIALCYALGFAQTSYHHATDAPSYATELAPLNAAGVYVTPAGGENISYGVHTFKYGGEVNAVFMERSNTNLPSYGRAKEIMVNSSFRFAVLSEPALAFPHWVRMGLWMSKARLNVTEIALQPLAGGEYTVSAYPLNPRDLPDTAQLKLFDLVSMRPSSLVENALIEAPAWWQGEYPEKHPKAGRFYLPAGMQHRI
ncbi:MAG: type I-D CRISPR-associated protein Cas5/Csc1 [Phototrophicaceae bacterium]|jgi:CRISPR-associated protein Csc1